MDTLSMPEPATKIQSGGRTRVSTMVPVGPLRCARLGLLTEDIGAGEEVSTDATKQQLADVLDAVDLPVSQLEHANHVVRPGGDGGDGAQADDAGDQP